MSRQHHNAAQSPERIKKSVRAAGILHFATSPPPYSSDSSAFFSFSTSRQLKTGQHPAVQASITSFCESMKYGHPQSCSDGQPAGEDGLLRETTSRRSVVVVVGANPRRTYSRGWIDMDAAIAHIYTPHAERLKTWTKSVRDASKLSTRRVFCYAFRAADRSRDTTMKAQVNADNLSLAAIAPALLLEMSRSPHPPLREEIGILNEIVHSLTRSVASGATQGLIDSFRCNLKGAAADKSKSTCNLATQLLCWTGKATKAQPSSTCSKVKMEAAGVGEPNAPPSHRRQDHERLPDMDQFYVSQLARGSRD